MSLKRGGLLLIATLFLSSCGPREDAKLFTLLEPHRSGVDFENTLRLEKDFNIISYPYFYDGGGVALGDVNGDDLPDIFLTGNQVSNRLFLNKGDFQFEDVTEKAGLISDGWSTGTTMADINSDGLLDIYVCQVNYLTQTGRNLLYINQRDGTFSEEAERYGLAFSGLSTQAAFLDYDRDGDLDMYLLNHSVHSQDSFGPAWRRTIDAPFSGDRLYRNDGGHFVNVSSDAGIYSSAMGYGLGLAVSDINDDGWPDIYVGNDFHENDYLYLNQKDGTFNEILQLAAGHTSQSTMGVDIADFNNDSWPDIIALDMMPPDWVTYQASAGPDEEGIAQIKNNFGFSKQVTRNTLQLHRGLDSSENPLFSEIGGFLGVHATEWSWTPLLADFDGDGWKDLFITNGIPRRPNNLDYDAFVAQPKIQRLLADPSITDIQSVVDHMPPSFHPNYAFKNNGGKSLTDVSTQWGLDEMGASTGAAYADLDNDGDLDIVANNINAPALVYRNNSASHHFLSVSLKGSDHNLNGIGSRITIYGGGQIFFQEQTPTRGFQSSVGHRLVFGLGAKTWIDSLAVRWPDGSEEVIVGLNADQHLDLSQRDASMLPSDISSHGIAPFFSQIPLNTSWAHRENSYEDFAHEPLIPHRLSTQGPALAVADANGDGVEDAFLGGASGQASVLLLGRATLSPQHVFDQYAAFEDVAATFFDADGDGDSDLYVVRGSGELDSLSWKDHLYLNDGLGGFSSSTDNLPVFSSNGSCVTAVDYDQDGDLDLFVGSRSIPGSYGSPANSYLLKNDGSGVFSNVTPIDAPILSHLGMVTDAVWADVTGTDLPDLVIVGEWMPITILENRQHQLVDVTDELGLTHTGGWWQSVIADDFDGDGDTDLIAGNLGLNTVLKAPMDIYVKDFNNDGRSDPMIVLDNSGLLWGRRNDVFHQLPELLLRVPTYAEYAQSELKDLVDTTGALRLTTHTFASVYLDNNGTFEMHRLPDEAQWSPILDMISLDIDKDGFNDVLAVGNFLGASTTQGPYTASTGVLLHNRGEGVFAYLEPAGMQLRGAAHSIEMLMPNSILVGLNNDSPLFFEFHVPRSIPDID